MKHKDICGNTRIPGYLLFCRKGKFSGASCATDGT